MQIREMSDQELQRHALSILQRELGAEGFARFLRSYRSGRGDYTKEREQWLKGVTIDDIVEQIRSADQPGHRRQAVDGRGAEGRAHGEIRR